MHFAASFMSALLASTAIAVPVAGVGQVEQAAKRQIGIVPPPGVSAPYLLVTPV